MKRNVIMTLVALSISNLSFAEYPSVKKEGDRNITEERTFYLDNDFINNCLKTLIVDSDHNMFFCRVNYPLLRKSQFEFIALGQGPLGILTASLSFYVDIDDNDPSMNSSVEFERYETGTTGFKFSGYATKGSINKDGVKEFLYRIAEVNIKIPLIVSYPVLD